MLGPQEGLAWFGWWAPERPHTTDEPALVVWALGNKYMWWTVVVDSSSRLSSSGTSSTVTIGLGSLSFSSIVGMGMAAIEGVLAGSVVMTAVSSLQVVQLAIRFLAVARISSQGFCCWSMILPLVQSMSRFSCFNQGRPRMKSFLPIFVIQALILLVSIPIHTGMITLWVILPDLLGVLSTLYTGIDLASHLGSSLSLMTVLGWMKIPPTPLSMNMLISMSFSPAKVGMCMDLSILMASSTEEIVTKTGRCCIDTHCPSKNPLHLSETSNAPDVLPLSHMSWRGL